MGIALGIAIGVALGTALDNLAMGIALGIVFGIIFDANRNRTAEGKKEEASPAETKKDKKEEPEA
jgi:MFS superfamily sulfate permease-like transporter